MSITSSKPQTKNSSSHDDPAFNMVNDILVDLISSVCLNGSIATTNGTFYPGQNASGTVQESFVGLMAI